MHFGHLDEGDLVKLALKNGHSEAIRHLALNLMGVTSAADTLADLLNAHPDWDFWVAAGFYHAPRQPLAKVTKGNSNKFGCCPRLA